MKLQLFTTIVLTVLQVSASVINLDAREDARIARDPEYHHLKRDNSPDRWRPVPTTPCTTPQKTTRKTTTKKETPRPTTPKGTSKTSTPKFTPKTTTPKVTPKTTTPKATPTTNKPTPTTKQATCVTESGQCDPTGTAFPPCCSGQCIQGFDAYFCRSTCLADGAPCTLDRPDLCCGQICLVDGHCVTVV